jgi:hypothetical protein
MVALRYLTLAWPGLPWLWLRGSMAGLILALASAVSLDVALVTTFIWGDLVELPFTIAVWTATGMVWLVSTVSAVATFPPPLARPPAAEVDPLFVAARDAYLARDWTGAESRLRELLVLSPTDGEAQLLLGTLLRRVGRLDEARGSLEKLAASDAGGRWRQAVGVELSRIAAAARGGVGADVAGGPPPADQASGDSEAPATRAAA